LGLLPERSKSGYSASRVEINSTPFIISRREIHPAPVIRCRSLLQRAAVASNWYECASQFSSEADFLSRKARDVYFKVRGGVVIKAINHGLDLADCAFRGDQGVDDATRWRLFADSRREALRHPRKIPLPTPPASQIVDTRRVANAPDVVLEDSRKLCFGELFGKVMIYQDSARACKMFWEELEQCQPQLVRLPNTDKRLYNCIREWPNTAPRLFYGEPMKYKHFVSRLIGRMAIRVEKRSHQIPLCLMSRVSCVDRWGLAKNA
jgi:hypothetical protein